MYDDDGCVTDAPAQLLHSICGLFSGDVQYWNNLHPVLQQQRYTAVCTLSFIKPRISSSTRALPAAAGCSSTLVFLFFLSPLATLVAAAAAPIHLADDFWWQNPLYLYFEEVLARTLMKKKSYDKASANP